MSVSDYNQILLGSQIAKKYLCMLLRIIGCTHEISVKDEASKMEGFYWVTRRLEISTIDRGVAFFNWTTVRYWMEELSTEWDFLYLQC